MKSYIYNLRWKFRMSRMGQALLTFAHKDNIVGTKLHDIIEAIVYED